MKIKLSRPVLIAGVVHRRGAEVDVSETRGAALVNKGIGVPTRAATRKAARGGKDKSRPTK